MRYSYEDAGGIIEDLDPDFGTTFRRPAVASPAQGPRQVLPFRTRTTVKPQQDSEELKERERRKLDPRRQDLVRRIVAGHPETKWGPDELQKLHERTGSVGGVDLQTMPRGVTTARGGVWTAVQVGSILRRVGHFTNGRSIQQQTNNKQS